MGRRLPARSPPAVCSGTVAPPRVLAVLPAFIPSTVISVVKPLVRLHRARRIRARIALEHFTRPRDLEWAEVAAFCRNSEARFARHREALLERGTPFVYDLDDNLFEIPADSEEGRSWHEPTRIAELTRYVERASLVRVYSDELRSRLAALNPRVVRVAPSLDWSLVPSEEPRRQPSRVRVVYVTSRLQDELARVFVPDLGRFLDRYGERVEVTFWGGAAVPLNRPGVRRLAQVPDYDSFLSRLGRSGFDVGLAPLVDDAFHRCKTNNKYREYGACRIAGVYSDVSVYSSCVQHERTGLLVPAREGAWLEALSRLVEDPRLRASIQEDARADVRARYSQERVEEDWLEQIERLRRAGPVAPSGVADPWPGAALANGTGDLVSRFQRAAGRLRRTGPRATLRGMYWYAHGLRTMLSLRRELSRFE